MFEGRPTPTLADVMSKLSLVDVNRTTEIHPGLYDLMDLILTKPYSRSHVIIWPTTEEKFRISRNEKDIPAELPTDLKTRWKRRAKRMKMPLVCGGSDKLEVLKKFLPRVQEKFAGVVFIDDQIEELIIAKDLAQQHQLLSDGYWVQRENNPLKTSGNINTISSLEDIGVLPNTALTRLGPKLVNKKLTDGILYAVGVNAPLSM